MKTQISLIFLLISTVFYAQQENNLLWEISKKDSDKKSYVYGTMHVNDKISYHLSDAFFEALLNVEVVANESNPETWGELTRLLNSKELENSYKLYSEFYLEPINKNKVTGLFSTQNPFFHNILSGNNNSNANYQEDTVLDMFIFQTGKKYNKIITGLEDAKMSIIPMYKLTEEETKPKEENKTTLLKLLKNKSLDEFINQSYREKNIVLLDSIYKLMVSPKVHDALIVNRNIIMANSIDEIIKNKTLFAAIGAAHLSGKEGVLELLRAKGYSVKPVSKELTEKGENLKKTIETNFPKPNLKLFTTSDGMLSLPLNESVSQEKNIIGSPDYTNGGVIKVQRKSLNNFVNKNGVYNSKSLDSLFFENIPGTIVKKDFNKGSNYVNYEIDNETKTGHSQHFSFYITPLEIISISMTGPKNYAKLYANDVFSKIKLKENSSNWINYKPKRGGFKVRIPDYYTAYGERTDNPENIELQAFIANDSSYYFVTERNLNSFYLLEDKHYEESQIQKEFFMQFDVEPTMTEVKNQIIESEGIFENKKIVLRTKVHGNKYYLLGTVNASKENNEQFFNSFEIQPFVYNETFEKYTDTVNDFSIEMPKTRNEQIFLELNDKKYESKDVFKNTTKSFTIKAENGKKIDFNYFPFHRYEYQTSLDSLKTNFRSYYTNFYAPSDDDYYEDDYDYVASTSILSSSIYDKKGFKKSNWHKTLFDKDYKEYKIIEETDVYNKENDTHTLTYLVGREGSNQVIKNVILFRNDAYITMKTLVEKDNPEKDVFIEKVINSATFIGKPKTTVFTNKIEDYIRDAYSEKDTIRYSALNSTYRLSITKETIPTITNFLNEFEYKVSEVSYQNQLLNKLGALQDEKIIPFFESYYKRENVAAETQISILEALTNQKSKKAYEKIIELLEYDLPLSSSEYDIYRLFNTFSNDLVNSKVLFPKIFQFYSIPEYKEPVINFCNTLIESKNASANKLNSFRKMILTNAKLEYKRLLSWKLENTEFDDDQGDEYVSEENYVPVEELVGYLNLLEQFKKNKETVAFIDKLKKLDILALDIEIVRLASLNNTLTEVDKKAILEDPKKAFLLMQLENDTYGLSIDDVAMAAITNFYNPDKNDSIQLYTKKEVTYKNHNMVYFFYKVTEKEPKNYEEKLTSMAFVVKENKLQLYTYRYFDSSIIRDEEKLEQKIESIINSSLNEAHFRASFEKKESSSNKYNYDEFDY